MTPLDRKQLLLIAEAVANSTFSHGGANVLSGVCLASRLRALAEEEKRSCYYCCTDLQESPICNGGKVYHPECYPMAKRVAEQERKKPEITFSPDQVEAIEKFIMSRRFSHELDRCGYAISQVVLEDWLSDHTKS